MIAPRPLGNMLMGNDSSMLRVQHGTKDLHPSALHRVTGTLYMLDHSGSANVAPHHSSYGLVDGNKPVMEIRVCCACRNQFDPSLQRSHRSGFFLAGSKEWQHGPLENIALTPTELDCKASMKIFSHGLQNSSDHLPSKVYHEQSAVIQHSNMASS